MDELVDQLQAAREENTNIQSEMLGLNQKLLVWPTPPPYTHTNGVHLLQKDSTNHNLKFFFLGVVSLKTVSLSLKMGLNNRI